MVRKHSCTQSLVTKWAALCLAATSCACVLWVKVLVAEERVVCFCFVAARSRGGEERDGEDGEDGDDVGGRDTHTTTARLLSTINRPTATPFRPLTR